MKLKQKINFRKMWGIKPVERVKTSKKAYRRERLSRKAIREYLTVVQ